MRWDECYSQSSRTHTIMIKLYRTLIFVLCSFFFFNDTATTEIYTLSLHDALPIYYAYLELLTSLPYNRVQKYYKLSDVCPSYCYLRYKDPNMTFKQFLVFFAMIVWRVVNREWPTNVQIQIALERRYGFSLWSINDLVRRVHELGYIDIVRRRNPREIIINKGLNGIPVSLAFRSNNNLLRKIYRDEGWAVAYFHGSASRGLKFIFELFLFCTK